MGDDFYDTGMAYAILIYYHNIGRYKSNNGTTRPGSSLHKVFNLNYYIMDVIIGMIILTCYCIPICLLFISEIKDGKNI